MVRLELWVQQHMKKQKIQLIKINQWNPDIVLSDIKMPGEDGISFLKKSKILRPELPVILITARMGRRLVSICTQQRMITLII